MMEPLGPDWANAELTGESKARLARKAPVTSTDFVGNMSFPSRCSEAIEFTPKSSKRCFEIGAPPSLADICSRSTQTSQDNHVDVAAGTQVPRKSIDETMILLSFVGLYLRRHE